MSDDTMKGGAMSNILYQFFQNSRHGNSDTLQMMMSREEWLNFVRDILIQMANGNEDIQVELVGRMISSKEDGE